MRYINEMTEANLSSPTANSLVVKRSIVINGRKTSISIETPFWNAAKEIAGQRDAPLNQLVGEIDAGRRSIICHQRYDFSSWIFM
jgi:predicted DNA-binding ribbon-helix-helix protein